MAIYVLYFVSQFETMFEFISGLFDKQKETLFYALFLYHLYRPLHLVLSFTEEQNRQIFYENCDLASAEAGIKKYF